MKVLLLGATGMIGQGGLRECLVAPDVETVVTLGRSATGQRHPKLGRAMLAMARRGSGSGVLEAPAINVLAREYP